MKFCNRSLYKIFQFESIITKLFVLGFHVKQYYFFEHTYKLLN